MTTLQGGAEIVKINELPVATTIESTDKVLISQVGATRATTIGGIQEGFLTDDDLDAHLAASNPHGITRATLDVYSRQQVDNRVNNLSAEIDAVEVLVTAVSDDVTALENDTTAAITTATTTIATQRAADIATATTAIAAQRAADISSALNDTALTGSPTAPTPVAASNGTAVATTRYVNDAIASGTIDTKLALIVDEKDGNTDGGSRPNGVWETRDLNTIKYNDIPGLTLQSNAITIAGTANPGRYHIRWTCPGLGTATSVSRLSDGTNNVAYSYSTRTSSLSFSEFTSGQYIANITADTTFTIEHFVSNSGSGSRAEGTRSPDNSGAPSIFTTVEITYYS